MKKRIVYFFSLITIFILGMLNVNASVGVSSGTTVSISVDSLGTEHLTCGRASSGWAAPMEFSKSDFFCANCGAYFPGCSASGCSTGSHTYKATDYCYSFGSSYPDQEEIWAVNNGGPMKSGSCSGCVSCSGVTNTSSKTKYYLQIYTSTESSSYQAIGKVVSIDPEEEEVATLVINKVCANGASGTYSFQIENSSGKVVKTFSLACGKKHTYEYSGGEITVSEINYDDDIIVSVGSKIRDYYETDIDLGDKDTVTFTNTLKDTTGDLTVKKVCDGVTGDFKFTVKDSSNTEVSSKTISCTGTTTSGTASFELDFGTYTVIETGYNSTNTIVSVVKGTADAIFADQISVTLSETKTSETVTFTNAIVRDKLNVKKVCDGVTGTFNFSVKNGSNTEVASKTISCTGETTTGVVSFDLEHGTYYVTETGYNSADTIVSVVKGSEQAILSDQISVTLSETKTSETVTFTNKAVKGVLKLEKKCTNEAITGPFSFKITGPNSYSNVITGISCGDTRILDNLTLGDYTVEEINLPNSYSNNILTNISNNKTTVSLTKNNPGTLSSPINVTFINSLATGSIKIKKVNETGLALTNVKFKLYMKNGDDYTDAKYSINSYCSTQGKTGLVGELETDNNGEIYVPCLDFGTYKIEETYNPDSSYVLAADTFVTIDQTSKHEYEVQIVNSSIKVKIIKTNLDGTITLDNAVFNIINKETGETFSDITVLKDEDNYLPLIPGTYTFTEVLSPVNYEALLNSFDIKVEENGTITLETKTDYVTLTKEDKDYILTIKNDTAKTNIVKKDSVSLENISNAKLQISKEDGILVTTFTSTDSISRIELPSGNYVLEEIKSPKGYVKLEDKLYFTVNEDRTITLKEDTNNNNFAVIDDTLVIYNVKEVKVPDTGKGLKIGLIIGGIAIISLGGFLIVKKKYTN